VQNDIINIISLKPVTFGINLNVKNLLGMIFFFTGF